MTSTNPFALSATFKSGRTKQVRVANRSQVLVRGIEFLMSGATAVAVSQELGKGQFEQVSMLRRSAAGGCATPEAA